MTVPSLQPRAPHRRSGTVVSTLALVAALNAHAAWAQVTVAGGATQATSAANGVPVVNIAAPNAAGLSHNTYTDYNVGSNGLVLNNTPANSGGAQAQLAGLVAANANLTGAAAKVILNEVTSTNRTTLAGYTEVLGAKASVIVANPNGITCGGCGFINTANVTLTTGAPTFNADGSIKGFSVRGGDILIIGAGLDAKTLDYAALLGRKVALNGPVFAQTLTVAGGAFDWDYAGQTATAVTPSGAAPDYAIDTSILGGMYANRIRLVATEAGVGVRVLGNAAASADDFSINAAGQIQIGGAISAQRDISLSTTSTASGAVTLSDASLTAARNLSLSSAGGGAILFGGVLTAGGDLTLAAATLQDTASAASLTNSNQRYAAGALTITVGGTAGLNGVSYGSAGTLTGAFGSLTAAQSGSLYSKFSGLSLASTQGGLNLGAYGVASANALSLTAQGGAITTTAGSSQGIVSSGGSIALMATGGLQNAGTIRADAGSVTLGLNGASTNAGAITAATNISLTDASGGATESFTNTGTAVAAGHLFLTAATLQNAGGLQAGLGLTGALGSLNNSGTLIASTDAASDGVLTIGALTNSGTLQSAHNLTLNLSSASSNTGLIVAANALTLAGGAASFTNQGGTVSAAASKFTLSGLANSGTIQTTGDTTLTLGGALTNSTAAAKIVVGGALASTSQSVSNAGVMQSAGAAQITATGTVTNTGVLYLGSGAGANGALIVGALDNQAGGYIQSAGDVAITTKGATLSNAGSVIATGALTITGQGAALALTNAGGGYLQAGPDTGVLAIGGANVSLTNAANGVLNGGKIALTLASAANAGQITAKTDLGYTVAGDLGNSGAIVARGQLTGSSGSLTNLTGGGVQGGTGMALVASGALSNDGQILGDPAGTGDVSITAATLSNTAHGVIQSPHNLTVNITGATLQNSGLINSVHDLNIHGAGTALALSNTGSGYIQVRDANLVGSGNSGTLTVDGAAVTLTNAANASIVGERLSVNVQDLTNAGVLAGRLGAATVTVANTLTNSGQLILNKDETSTVGVVSAATLVNAAGGVLQSGTGLKLAVSQALTNNATISATNDLTIQTGTSSATLQNTGATANITAGGALTVTGANSTLATDAGSKASGATVNLTLASLTNAGSLLSGGAFHYALGTGLTNSSGGLLGAVGALTGSSASLINAGVLQANGSASLTSGTIQNQVGGKIYSLSDLTLLITGGSLTNAGLIFGQTGLTFTGSGASLAIVNEDTGVIETDASGTGALTIDGAAVSLDNQSGLDAGGAAISGKIIAGGLSLNLTGLTNSGLLQSTGAGAITTSGVLTNTGTLIVSGGTGVGTVNIQRLDNRAGATFAFGRDGTLNTQQSLSNVGTIFAGRDLTLHSTGAGAFSLTNGAATGAAARIQGGGVLHIDSGASLTNNATGVIVADSLPLTLTSLTNSGTIQGGSGSDTWRVSTLTNNAGGAITLNTTSGVTGSILTNSIDNNGLLQALGSLQIGVASHIGQAATGSILANGGVYLYSQSAPQTFAFAGSISAGALLKIGRDPGGLYAPALSLNLADGASLYGGTVSIDAPTVTLAGGSSGGVIASAGAMTLSTDALSFGGVRSRILAALGGAGDAAITVRGAGGFTNAGLIYSADTLHFTTANGSITNSATGGISAGNGLTVTAVSGDITNNGELYGGSSVALVTDTNHTITNAYNGADVFTAAAEGSIDSGGSITATTGTFFNSSSVNAAGDITISAANFKNVLPGDWTKTSTSTETGTPALDHGYYDFGTPYILFGINLQPAKQAHIGQTTTVETFNNGAARANFAPQIVSSGTLTIKDFSTGQNVGAVLSGSQVVVQGLNNASTFLENDDFALKTTVRNYVFYYDATYRLNGNTGVTGQQPSPGTYASISVDNVQKCSTGTGCTDTNGPISVTNSSTLNTGIFAGSLTASGFGLTVKGSAQTVALGTKPTGTASGTTAAATSTTTPTTPTAPSAPAAATIATTTSSVGAVSAATTNSGVSASAPAQSLQSPISTTTVNGRTAITISGVTVALPTNPNGLFVTTPGSSSGYLVETNPLYTTAPAAPAAPSAPSPPTPSTPTPAAPAPTDSTPAVAPAPTPVETPAAPTTPTTTPVSSTLLAQQLGIETIAKRLGDASYEAYLIAQQLLGQTGRSLLSSYNNQQAELTALYTSAAGQASTLGFTWGQPLSDVQVANLNSDIVWMVSTKVNGQTVLAPVVYLSAATKAALITGSGIVADNIDANLASLTNTGGAIVGAQTNRIVTVGSLVNTGGGTIAGDQVVLQSVKGAVVNNDGVIKGTTLAAIDGATGVSNIGGSITGAQVVVRSLNGGVDNSGGLIAGSTFAAVQGKGDIVNKGGSITGGDVVLKSTSGAVDLNGGNVGASGLLAVSTLKDININKPTALHGADINLTSTGGDINVVTPTTTKATGPTSLFAQNYTTDVSPTAGLQAAGSISLNAAKDVNIQGGSVKAGGDIALIAGDKLTIGTVADREASSGAVKSGDTTTTSRSNSVTQIGSTVAAGGNLYAKSGGDTSITGSTLTSGGSAAIVAGGAVNIVGATDFDQSSSTAVRKTSTAGVATGSTTQTSSTSTTNVASNVKAGGDLIVVSGKDTNIVGSNVGATGDVGLLSGGKLTIAAATDTSRVTSDYRAKGVVTSAHNSSDVATTTNVGSTITAGGSLTAVTKGDVNIVGSALTVGKDAYIDTNGSKLNIVAGQNTSTTDTLTQRSGLGVNSSLYGSNKTTAHDAETTNAASNITVGGNLVSVGNDKILVQGSNVTVGKIAVLKAANGVTVTDGADTSHKTSQTVTESVFGGTNKSSTSLAAGASASGSAVTASGQANASASAKASDSSTVSFYNKTTTNTQSDSSTSVGSNIKVGNDLYVDAGKGDLTVQGSKIAAGGGFTVDAQNVVLLAGKNTATSSTTTDSKTFGVFNDVKAGVQASAGVSAKAQSGQASADAGASANVTATSTLGLRSERSSATTDKLTNTGSTLSAGTGDLVLNAKNTIHTEGANLSAGGFVVQNAKNVENLAAQDHDYSTSKSSSVTAGLFVEGTAKAAVTGTASANAGLMGIGASAGVKGSASATATGTNGVRVATAQSESDKGSTTAVTTKITAGRGIVRTAADTITDQGSQLATAGDITQSAKTVNSLAAQNTSYGDSSSIANEARFGAYATAAAKVSGGASAGAGGQSGGSGSVEATAGFAASDDFSQSKSSNRSSTAVVTNYAAGGKITTTTTGAQTFEGVNLNAAKGIDITAGKVDFTAAKNTSSQTSDGHTASASVRVGVVGKADLDVGVSYGQDSGSLQTSNAVVGSINSGKGGINIKTTNGDATFTGTKVTAAKDVNVETNGGKLNVLAAQSTSKSSTETVAVNLGVTASKGAGGVSVSAGGSRTDGEAVTNTVGQFTSGGTVNLTGDKGVVLQGAQVYGAAGANVIAKTGGVQLVEALDTNRQTGGGASVALTADKSTKYQQTGDAAPTAVSTTQSSSEAVSFNVKDIDQAHGQAASIRSGGNTVVSGDTITSQGATIYGASSTSKVGAVKNTAVTNRDIGVDIGVTATGASEKKTPAPAAKTATTTPSVSATPTGPFSPTPTSTSSTTAKTVENGASNAIGIASKGLGVAANALSKVFTYTDPSVVKPGGAPTPTTTAPSSAPPAPTSPSPTTPASLRTVNTDVRTLDTAPQAPPRTAPPTAPAGTPPAPVVNDSPYKSVYSDKKTVGDGAPTIITTAPPASTTGLTAPVDPKPTAAPKIPTAPKDAAAPAAQPALTLQGPVTITPPNLPPIPPGQTISAASSNGAPLPSWLLVNPLTGQVTGTPPASILSANKPVTVVVSVPQPNGTTQKVTMILTPNQFVGQER